MEILFGCGTSVAAEASNSLLARIKKHVCFVFSYNENMKILGAAQKKLNAKISDAYQLAADTSHSLKNVGSTVSLWQEEACELRKSAEPIMSHHANSRRSLCPNPWSRYSWSKKAWELTQKINEKDRDAPDFGTTFVGLAQNVGDKFNLAGVVEFESRSSIIDGVLEALKDKTVSMCSICGMGGVGKTTLAKKLVQRVEAENLFAQVAIITISQNPNFQAIQSEIIEQLRLKIEEQTMTMRASKLNSWLVKHNTLLVLDDVWWKLNAESLEEVGIPLSRGSCKIVLTSRNEDKCSEMGSQHNFRVGVLEDEEALNLFREHAGISAQRFNSDETAKKIALECGGLPIAIVTIASGLKGKPQCFWNDSLSKLQNSKADSLGVYSRIQVSYDLLSDEEAKACFRLCCLYPEDHNIPVEDLVLYGKGLQIFDNVETMAQARDRVESIVHKLKKSFMLLEGDQDEFVKMHDLIRDFAISISSKHEHPCFVKCENDSTRWPEKSKYENCSAISIMSSKVLGLPDRLECPQLELLQLTKKYSLETVSSNLLIGTEELKVLSMDIPSVPQSLDLPKKLRTFRVRQGMYGLNDSKPSQLGDMLHDNLNSLEILSISIRRPCYNLLEKIAWLCSLRFLDLSDVNIRYISPGMFSKLVKLEELYLPWKFGHWGCKEQYQGGRINAGLSEIESLPLTAVRIGIFSGSVLAEKFVRNLTRFQVFFGGSFYDDFVRPLGYSKKLVEMYDVEASAISASWIIALLSRCEKLRLTRVRNLKNVLCLLIEQDSNRTGKLKEMYISHCNELEYLADDAVTDRITCFSELKLLQLKMLQNLKEVICCSRKIEEAWFSNLSWLHITGCYKLKHVFPVSVCRGLGQLQCINIWSCDEMEAIFYKDRAGDGNADQVVSSSIIEGQTDKLIQTSPKPTSNHKAKTTTCPNPCSIIPGIFGRDKQSISVPNDLQVENTPEEVGLKMDTIVFAQLKTLTMINMPKLRILYEGNEAIEMPSLQELAIMCCDNIEAVSYGSLKAPRLQNVKINDIEYLVEGDLNTIVKNALRNGDGENEIRTCN